MTREEFKAFLAAHQSDALAWIAEWLMERPLMKRLTWMRSLAAAINFRG